MRWDARDVGAARSIASILAQVNEELAERASFAYSLMRSFMAGVIMLSNLMSSGFEMLVTDG